MNRTILIVLLMAVIPTFAQEQGNDTLILKGQLSAWGNYNFTNENFMLGGRYIPELSYQRFFKQNQNLNLEVSGNLYGTLYENTPDGDIKPYRAWARYATPQFEVRAGLQKINFGSATMLRPLMWFDQMDPRDPLQLTDGVWGVLGRYYFLNNANIWVWGLYGNKEPKGWELLGTHPDNPEFGGRIQLPIGIGEAAITYHNRKASTLNISDLLMPDFERYTENRIGFDAKVDWVVGLWVEGAWINSRKDIGLFTNQTLLNTGVDYTFGIGNGLLAVYEHLIVSSDVNPFEFVSPFQFSLLSLSYPVGLFDNLSAMFYYSWNNSDVYSFLNWQRTYNRLSFHVMAYWNPKTLDLPQQNLGSNLFGGKGIQVMLVLNH
jgi:hypothetical protein